MGIIYNIFQKSQYLIGIILFLVFLMPPMVCGKQPIHFKKWKINDTTFVKNIGGSVRNYEKPDKTWDSIINIFEADGDSVFFVNKSVLKARINKNGTSTVSLMWNDITYTVTQKLLGIGWIKISTRQSQWIDSTMSWSNFSVDSNICKWTGISPGVDYRVLKDNGRVAHGIFYKAPFLDSAVILYDQRPDSLDIALANVMVYTLSANIDNADSAIGDVSGRKLKDFGYYGFNLSNQRLRFPGSDTLPQIPVRQYWEQRGDKIICIEYVMMKWVKQVHEAYPSATIWHNDSKTIDGTTNVEDTYIFSGATGVNYGAKIVITSTSTSSMLVRVKNVASELGAKATISACVCSLYCSNNVINGTLSDYVVFKPWNEGTQDNQDCADPGCSYADWACDDYEWTDLGCECDRDGGVDNTDDGGVCDNDVRADRKATAEDNESVTTVNTWYSWTVSNAIAQGWYAETKSEDGILIKTSDGANVFNSTEGASNQPFWVFTYTVTQGFGVDNVGEYPASIEDAIVAVLASPDSSGNLDSAKVHINVTTESHEVKMAVYLWSDTSFIDSTEIIDVSTGEGWVYFDFVNNASITASTEYAIAVWAEGTTGGCEISFDLSGGSHVGQTVASYGVWPTPKWTTVNDDGSFPFSIYCFYTPSAPPEAAGQVIIIQQ